RDQKQSTKTYNSGDSPVVTRLTTSPPVEDLTCGERTRASAEFRRWSYVTEFFRMERDVAGKDEKRGQHLTDFIKLLEERT
ncbi:hypothetical protein COCC4DRAFT_147898, partial [Bipolaris maydis ATCC 48331]